MSKNSYATAHYVAPAIQNTRRIGTLIAIFASALLAHEAFATDYVWTTGSGYWTNLSMWGGSGYPGQSSSDTATWNTTPALTVTEDTTLTMSTAYLRNTNAVTLQINSPATLTITNAFVIGDLSSTTGSLILVGGGTLAITNGGTAQLIVGQGGQGTFNLNGGNLICDQIICTNNPNSTNQYSILTSSAGSTCTVLHGSTWYANNFANYPVMNGTWNFFGGTNLFTNNTASQATTLGTYGKINASGSNTLVRAVTPDSNSGGYFNVSSAGSSFVFTNGATLYCSAGAGHRFWFANAATSRFDNASMIISNMGVRVGSTGNNGSGGLLLITNNSYGAVYSPNYIMELGYGSNNTLVISGNSTFTNNDGIVVGSSDGTRTTYNSMIVSAGGKWLQDRGYGLDSTYSYQAGYGADYCMLIGNSYGNAATNDNNYILVTGPTSVINTPSMGVGIMGSVYAYSMANSEMTNNYLIVSNGATVYVSALAISTYEGSCTNLGVNVISNNYVLINGGSLYATTKLRIGSTNPSSGYASIMNGGLLQANTITNVNPSCYVTNNGGIYQFTTATPAL